MLSSRPFVTCSALALLGGGVVLLFDPQSIGSTSQPTIAITSLYAAALIGLALATWIGRTGPMGGIYGRALVTGNFGHAFIGCLSLLRPAMAAREASVWWAALALYALLAIGWGYLLFWSSGLQRTT